MHSAEDFEASRQGTPFHNERDTAIAGFDTLSIDWQTAKDEAPPYWSKRRDAWLRKFWRSTDLIKVAVYTFTSKVLSVPFQIHPTTRGISEHTRLAAQFTDNILCYSGLMRGWRVELTRFIQDYLTADNGAFLYVMGNGPASEPVAGMPLGIYHLDSARCTRTRSAEFPVVYKDRDGKLYKLHHTRVICMTNLSSPELDLNGVGLCAVSCAIDAGTEEQGIGRYNLEKMGSRPQRGILYVKRGGTIDQLQAAIALGDAKMDADGLTHFTRTLLMAPRTSSSELDLGHIPLTGLPDHFNRIEAATINVARVAGAFGLDARDLGFSLGGYATRADAEVQDRKGRGKGVGEFIDALAEQINHYLLPDTLHAVFDYVDDEADRVNADIRLTRASARQSDLTAGVTDIRQERESMLERGEITQDQFEDLELRDGRLDDGMDVLMLFSSVDKAMAELLDLGVPDPTNLTANDPQSIIQSIEARRRTIFAFVRSASSARRVRSGKRALAALDKLESLYSERSSAILTPAQSDAAAQTGMEIIDPLSAPDISSLSESIVKSFHTNGYSYG